MFSAWSDPSYRITCPTWPVGRMTVLGAAYRGRSSSAVQLLPVRRRSFLRTGLGKGCVAETVFTYSRPRLRRAGRLAALRPGVRPSAGPVRSGSSPTADAHAVISTSTFPPSWPGCLGWGGRPTGLEPPPWAGSLAGQAQGATRTHCGQAQRPARVAGKRTAPWSCPVPTQAGHRPNTLRPAACPHSTPGTTATGAGH
jgi:hypothetical protein